MSQKLKADGHNLVPVSSNLIDRIWEDKPSRPLDKIFVHKQEFAGFTRIKNCLLSAYHLSYRLVFLFHHFIEHLSCLICCTFYKDSSDFISEGGNEFWSGFVFKLSSPRFFIISSFHYHFVIIGSIHSHQFTSLSSDCFIIIRSFHSVEFWMFSSTISKINTTSYWII